MSHLGRASVMLFLGTIAVRLILTGGFGWFVQQHMRIPLAIAGFTLLAFGVHEFLLRASSTEDGHEHDHHDHADAEGGSHATHAEAEGSDHGDEGVGASTQTLTEERRWAGPRVGWLMLAPLIVLISAAPTGLGAAAAERVDAFVPLQETEEFPPLDQVRELTADAPAGGALPMRVFDFLDRAVWDENGSLEGELIQLEGLVVNDPDVTDGFKLTRFMVSCCAADGIPLQVVVRGVEEPFADDTWVVVDLTWIRPDVPYRDLETEWEVEAEAVSISVIEGIPNDPYESPY